jgi:hypothetical protein
VTDVTEPERLDVLAALLEADPEGSREADAWVRADGSPAEASLIDSATPGEWDLAAAVRGGGMNDVDVNAIVALLRMAEGTPLAGALRIGLHDRFLDDEPADHAAVFADAYRRLALPGLDSEARESAEPLLQHLGG